MSGPAKPGEGVRGRINHLPKAHTNDRLTIKKYKIPKYVSNVDNI